MRVFRVYEYVCEEHREWTQNAHDKDPELRAKKFAEVHLV